MICVTCRRFMRNKRTGVTIEELRPPNNAAIPGGEGWLPYKLWQADLYECPTCNVQMVSGFGFRPIKEHYEADYAHLREALGVFLAVADCGPSHAGPPPTKAKHE